MLTWIFLFVFVFELNDTLTKTVAFMSSAVAVVVMFAATTCVGAQSGGGGGYSGGSTGSTGTHHHHADDSSSCTGTCATVSSAIVLSILALVIVCVCVRVCERGARDNEVARRRVQEHAQITQEFLLVDLRSFAESPDDLVRAQNFLDCDCSLNTAKMGRLDREPSFCRTGNQGSVLCKLTLCYASRARGDSDVMTLDIQFIWGQDWTLKVENGPTAACTDRFGSFRITKLALVHSLVIKQDRLRLLGFRFVKKYAGHAVDYNMLLFRNENRQRVEAVGRWQVQDPQAGNYGVVAGILHVAE
jgi:hypothetical protein